MHVTSWQAVQVKLEREARKFLQEAYGLELKIPVELNGRLKNKFGRFRYYARTLQPISIELSKNYVEYQDEETVMQTLKHECIHYALFTLRRPHTDGHPIFEGELAKHGSHSTGTVEYRGKGVRYECVRCGIHFDRKRRLKGNGFGYTCSVCKSRIKFVGEIII